jgi:alpha-mannosidase
MIDPSAAGARQLALIVRHNHFDATWRRCWDRSFVSDGQRFVSYRTVQEAWMDDMLRTSADPRNVFMTETTWTTRHYVERHPEAAAALAGLWTEGRFEQLGAGENIIDTNLVHGELLARNLALGMWWSERVLGRRPQTGYYRDAFGTSAQLPQLFRQCGLPWIAHMDYNIPDAPYWRGLDGSTVLYLHPEHTIPFAWACVASTGSMHPCPACRGAGCAACDARGYAVGRRSDFVYRPDRTWDARAVIFIIGNEENLPGLHVGDDVARFNTEQDAFYVVQATYHDLEPLIAGELAAVDAPPAALTSTKVENNPCITGVYVSRIKVKQGHRALEHRLLAAETWNALLGGAQADILRGVWRNLTFSGFHDAVTSSCCDDSYWELLDLHAEMRAALEGVERATLLPRLTPDDSAVTLFNHHGFTARVPVTVPLPAGWEGARVTSDGMALPVYEVEDGWATFLAPVVPALGAHSVDLAPAPAARAVLDTREVACGPFALQLGDYGITGVRHEDHGAVAETADWLFGELVLEHDEGDSWSTRTLDHTRERLSPYTRLQRVERVGESIAVTYTGAHPSFGIFGLADPNVLRLAWAQTFRLRAGSPWLEIETLVEWYTYNRRLRLAFPTTTRANAGVYEIPYGVLERPRYDPTDWDFVTPDGDWPAIHWAGVQTDAYTYAVLNQGTPSYRVEDGTVLVSVLRSPVSPGGLLQPTWYVAHNFTTITDHGQHRFRHALFLGEGDWRGNDVVRQAALFNAGVTALPGRLAVPLSAWTCDAAHTQLATVKAAEDGRGVVARLVETAGQPETVTLAGPFTEAYLCTLLEDDEAPLPVDDGHVAVPLAPWKIVSMRLL